MSNILEFLTRQDFFTPVDTEAWDGFFTLGSGDGWVLVSFELDETFHTYKYPLDWI